MVKVAEGGGLRASVWAGVWIGLAGACKYVPVVLLLPLFLAHPRETRWRGTALALGAALLAMFAASPFTFLDWNMTADAFTVQRRSLLSPWVGQSAFPIALPTYLIASLPNALGWPVYALSLLGSVLLWRGGRPGRVVVGSALAIVLANGMLRAAQDRYMIVAFPLFFAAAAAGVVWIADRLALHAPGRAPSAAFAGVALLAIAWPLPELWRVRSALRLPDSRHESRRWINANIDTQSRMAVELYGPVVDQRERNVVIWPFFATQAPLVRAAYHVAYLDGVQYLVTSGEISRRFIGDSLNYPVEAAYYRRLRETGQVLWRSDPERFAGPRIEVRALPESLGTRAERDSIFEEYVPDSVGTYRLALWCMDFSTLFGRSGAFAKAEEWARRGLHVDSKRLNPRLYGSLAYAQYQQGDFEGSAATATAGLAETPSAHALHFYRGMALQAMGRLEEALADVRAAIAASGDPRMRLNAGQLLSLLGRDEEAVAELDQVPTGHPDRAAARRDMAVILLNRLGRRAEGIAALREAAALTQDPGEARLLREEADRLEGTRR
jgi:tetratricopeptide (TPR) repeat protein